MIQQVMETLDLERIRDGFPGLTPGAGGYLLEAAVLCLNRQRHSAGVVLKITGSLEKEIALDWKLQVDSQLDRTWKDQNVTTEHGALCLAILLVPLLTDYVVLSQASPGEGFDYYLIKKNKAESNLEIFQYDAKLEVSGIFQGNRADINRRFFLKVIQTGKSLDQDCPVYICIVEFSLPQTRFEENL